MSIPDKKTKLILLLQSLYVAELVAAHIFHGQWLAAEQISDRIQLREYEDIAWGQRQKVGRFLADWGESPSRRQVWLKSCQGRIQGFLCGWIGRTIPYFCALRRKSHSVQQYRKAAKLALAIGQHQMSDELYLLAAAEEQQEIYFQQHIGNHWLKPLLARVFR